MPGVAALRPVRFTLELSADFRTTPGLIFFYSYSGRIPRSRRMVPSFRDCNYYYQREIRLAFGLCFDLARTLPSDASTSESS